MKDLLVTLADNNYVDQAKQLFSSAYFNAGWSGDFMLLAHNISDNHLSWFRSKGILIKQFGHNATVNEKEDSPKINKFWLFTPEFKKWDHIVYLDADIIVRASLDRLKRISGFYATTVDAINDRLLDQFLPPSRADRVLYKDLRKNYNLLALAFNSGVMAFSTDTIKEDAFMQIQKLYNRYIPLTKLYIIDQPVLNLYFYSRWRRLPVVYNILYETYGCAGLVNRGGPIVHFNGAHKPWHKTSHFFDEWKGNLARADKIDLRSPSKDVKKTNAFQIWLHSFYLQLCHIVRPLHLALRAYRLFGLLCYFLYVSFPKLYFGLVRVRDE